MKDSLKCGSRTISFFLAILIPFVFFIEWRSLNSTYPRNDEAAYFELAQEYFIHYQNDGIVKTIKQVYFHRHFKPILHTVLVLPILILTDGDIRISEDIYCGLMMLFLLFAVYLFLSKYLNRKTEVFLGVTFFSFVPWIFGMLTTFNSELTFVTASLYFFYLIHDKDSFEDLKQSVLSAFFLSLMMCLRPVETVLLTAFALFVMILNDLRSKKIFIKDLLQFIFWPVIFIFIILMPYFVLMREWSTYELLCIFIVVFIHLIYTLCLQKKNPINKSFHYFFGFFFLVIIFWYAPVAKSQVNWIFITNFDILAQETGNRVGYSIFDFLASYVVKLGLLPFVLSVIYIFSKPKNRSINKRFLVFITSCIVVPVAASCLTYNGDVRYYYGGWAALMLMLLVATLKYENSFYKLRIGIIFIIAALLTTTTFSYIRPLHYSINSLTDSFGKSYFILRPVLDEKYGSFQTELSNILSRHSRRGYRVLSFQNVSYPFIEPPLLSLIAREKKELWKYGMLFTYGNYDSEKLKNLVSQRYDYAMAGPVEADWNTSKGAAAAAAKVLISNCLENRSLEDTLFAGYQSVGKIVLQGLRPESYCLFVNNNSTPDSKINLFH